jgi:hypothetical protein
MQMPAMAFLVAFSPFGAKKATIPKMNPPAMTSKATAPSISISTGLPLRARRPTKYSAMLKQGASRLNSAARAMNEVDRGGGCVAGSCLPSRCRISAERSAPQPGQILAVRISLPGIAPWHIGQVTGSIAIRMQASDIPQFGMALGCFASLATPKIASSLRTTLHLVGVRPSPATAKCEAEWRAKFGAGWPIDVAAPEDGRTPTGLRL